MAHSHNCRECGVQISVCADMCQHNRDPETGEQLPDTEYKGKMGGALDFCQLHHPMEQHRVEDKPQSRMNVRVIP